MSKAEQKASSQHPSKITKNFLKLRLINKEDKNDLRCKFSQLAAKKKSIIDSYSLVSAAFPTSPIDRASY